MRAAAVAAAHHPHNKVIHLVRHGQTEMNVALGMLPKGCRYGEAGFQDPHFPDTQLTAAGRAQAVAARAAAAALAPAPEVVVASPLTRALSTADLVFAGFRAPRLALPLAAERLYLSSDIGRPRAELESEFERYCFAELPHDDPWWHTEDGAGADSWAEELLEAEDELSLIDAHEPAGVFLQRVERLRQWLAARPESSIALVSHWGVLHALTGTEFDNCEVRSVRLSELRARPHLLGERNGAPAGQAA